MIDDKETMDRYAQENEKYNRAMEELRDIPFGDERRRGKWDEIRGHLAAMEAIVPTAAEPLR